MEVTQSLMRRQRWMADEETFSNVSKRIIEVKDLTSKREDHPYVKEFMTQWRVLFVYGTYILEGEIDPNFSSNETWNLLRNAESGPSQSDESVLSESDESVLSESDESVLSESDESVLSESDSIQRRMINGMRALEYLQEQINNDLTISQIKQVHKMIMDKEKHKNGKDVLVGEFRTTPVFAGYKVFAPVSAIERLMSKALERYRFSDDEPILAATKLFVDLINIHPFEDGNGRLCRMILSHVLMKSGCSLFPVMLSSYHKRGRRHYIQAVRRWYENPSMLYTMVATSLVHVWDNFEENVTLLDKFEKPYSLIS